MYFHTPDKSGLRSLKGRGLANKIDKAYSKMFAEGETQ